MEANAFEVIFLLKHSNCFFLRGMKYFLSFCHIVSPSNRRRGQGIEAGNSLSQECSWE